MKLPPFIRRYKSVRLTVEPFGGELRAAPVSPERAIRQLGVHEFIILLLLCVAITMSLLNIGLSLIAQHKARASAYVADGTPFGCRVREIGK